MDVAVLPVTIVNQVLRHSDLGTVEDGRLYGVTVRTSE
jgi:hypothetical protein